MSILVDHSISVGNDVEKTLAEEVHLQESLEDSVGTEVPENNIYEAPIECELCAKSTQLACRICNTQFCNLVCSIQDRNENEGDMKHHLIRVHEYGKSCLLYPSDECGYSAGDVVQLELS